MHSREEQVAMHGAHSLHCYGQVSWTFSLTGHQPFALLSSVNGRATGPNSCSSAEEAPGLITRVATQVVGSRLPR